MTHRHLFQEEQIESLQDVTQNSLQDYLYLKIPKRRNKSKLLRELDVILQDNLKGEKEILFPFSRSAIPYVRLHIEYNCLVMAFNGVSRKDIMNWVNPRYKNIMGVVQQKYAIEDDGTLKRPFSTPSITNEPVPALVSDVPQRIAMWCQLMRLRALSDDKKIRSLGYPP